MVKKIIISIYLCLLIGISSYTQSSQQVWCWLEQLGSKGWDKTNGISIDSENNIYVAGDFANTLEGSKKSVDSEGESDVYVARYTNEGKLDWLWSAGGQGNDKITALTSAPDDDLYISGILDGSMEFGNKQIEGNNKKLFVARINKKGSCEWVFTLSYSKMASGYILNTDKSGNVLLGGVFNDTLAYNSDNLVSNGFRDIFLLRLDSDGNLDEMKQYGSKMDESLTAISADTLGNIVISGNNEAEITMDNLTLEAPYSKKYSNCFVTALDSSLTAQWSKCFYSNSYSTISGLECLDNGNIFLTGSFKHTLHIDDLEYTCNGASDFFISRLDSLGNILWLKTYGGKYDERSSALKINNLGGVMVMGNYNNSLELDSLQITSEGARKDAFVAQWDSSGSVSWAGTLEGSSNNIAKFGDLDNEGNLYLTGSFRGSLAADDQEVTSSGEQDVFIAKYYNCPSVDNAIEGIFYLCPGGETEISVDKSYSSIVWNDSINTGRSLTVDSAGTYHVYMVNTNGCVVKDTVSVIEETAYVFSLGEDTIICVGQELELDGPAGFEAYEWQDGSSYQTYTVSNEENSNGKYNYWLVVTDSLECQWSDSIQVQYYINPASTGESSSNISIFPNPVEDSFYWNMETGTDDSYNIEVEINALSGINVYKESIENYTSNQVLSISVENLNSATYYFSVLINGERETTKFIKR